MSTLFGYWAAGGPLMVPLAALCVATWFWTVTLYSALLRARASFRGLHGLVHALKAERKREAVASWAGAHPGPAARLAEHVMGAGDDRSLARSRLTEARSAEVSRFSRELVVLKGLVAAAPLLGLLGTVMGMIATFSTLSARGTASMEVLSGGISEALITTQVGLVVALPGLLGAHAVGRRLADLDAALDRLGLHLAGASAPGAGRGRA